MPLVVIAGCPCSGKTTVTARLKTYFEDKTGFSVKIISDEELYMDKNTVYADSREEKELRGNLKSAVQRHVSKDSIVILDSPNYIKGYRYELYCVTKSAQTTQCVIHCIINKEVAQERNMKRQKTEQYNQEVFDGLFMRFESPQSKNRWDSPLFLVHPDEDVPFQLITDALLERKAPPPNKSTLSQPLSSTNFLHELDKITQSVVQAVMEGQKMSVPGDKISVTGSKDKVELTRTLTLAELQRCRRQFISFTKAHPVDNKEKLANMFVQFLNSNIR